MPGREPSSSSSLRPGYPYPPDPFAMICPFLFPLAFLIPGKTGITEKLRGRTLSRSLRQQGERTAPAVPPAQNPNGVRPPQRAVERAQAGRPRLPGGTGLSPPALPWVKSPSTGAIFASKTSPEALGPKRGKQQQWGVGGRSCPNATPGPRLHQGGSPSACDRESLGRASPPLAAEIHRLRADRHPHADLTPSSLFFLSNTSRQLVSSAAPRRPRAAGRGRAGGAPQPQGVAAEPPRHN